MSRRPLPLRSESLVTVPWLRAVEGGGTVTLAVQPNAKSTEIIGTHGEALKIKVASPPVEGAANRVLATFLASLLGVKQRDVTLLRGASSRQKTLKIEGVSYESARVLSMPPDAD